MILRPAPRTQAPRALALLALLVAAAGCTEKLVALPPPPPVSAVPDSIQEVFTASCALSGCHAGPSPAQGQDLSDAVTSYANIVGVPSQQRPAFQRIAPGDSANSYIVMKLRNDPRKGGSPMPLGDFPLDPALTLRIATWAHQGAPAGTVPAGRIARN
jgi:hypothetical protein